MLRAKLLFFFLVLIGIPKGEAQTNFLKGYYITSSQDTIQGYIDYRSERRNYRLCVFRESLNSKSITLSPKNILGFTVDNKDFYETHSLISRKGEELFGFFKVMVRGKLSLLRYTSRYFVKETSGKLSEISKSSELTEDRKLREDYSGLGLLIFLMKDCDEISRHYLEQKYKSNIDYVYVFEKYNQCVGSSFNETKKITIRPHFDFGLQVSPAVSKFSFKSSFERANFENKLSVGGGGFVSIFLPKTDENARLVVEATYSKYNYYSYFSFDYSNNDLFVDYSSVKVPLLLRFGQKRFFLDLGIQNQFILDQHLKWRVEEIGQNTIFTSDGAMTPLSKWSYGFLAGLGVKYEVGDHAVRSSLRFSQTQNANHPNKPVNQVVEFIFSFQFTK